MLAGDLDDALALVAQAHASGGRRVSIGLLGNAAEILPGARAAREGRRAGRTSSPTRPPRTTSSTATCRSGWTVERWKAAQGRPPSTTRSRDAAGEVIAVHVRAMLDFQAMGVPVVDYGNNIRAGREGPRGRRTRSSSRGSCPAYIRPLFCEGKGPFRWVALSGDPEDIYRTDEAVKALFPANARVRRWLDMARERIRFQGLPARICWLGLGRTPPAGSRSTRWCAPAR